MVSSDDREFSALKRFIHLRSGFDCNRYKEAPLKRRVRVRMRATGVHTYAQYHAVLKEDSGELSRLFDVLTINVTKFFRNQETYRVLKEKVLRELIANKRGARSPGVRIWSAGCSSGEETYSVAILLRELLGPGFGDFQVEVWGTDVDERSIEKAEAGVYAESSLDEMDWALRDKYFKVDGGFRISPEIKQICQFFQLDLLSDENPLTALDLILCRNVLIYFSRDFQERMFRDFADRLRPGGYLVLGKVETLVGEARALFQTVDNKERIYQIQGV